MAVAWKISPLEAAQVAPSTFVVTASGALDDSFAAELRDLLLPLAGADGWKVILDVGSVHDLGPSSLDVICEAAQIARARGMGLIVVGARPPLANSLAECGLDSLIRIERTLEIGLAS